CSTAPGEPARVSHKPMEYVYAELIPVTAYESTQGGSITRWREIQLILEVGNLHLVYFEPASRTFYQLHVP
ncbi:MAG: hypothetical protein ACRESW_08525, partial [Nevskiales bacterium]